MEEKKIWRKIKNRFKLNKLILYVYSNLFYLFLYVIYIDYEMEPFLSLLLSGFQMEPQYAC